MTQSSRQSKLLVLSVLLADISTQRSMAHGCTLEQFEKLMGALVAIKQLVKRGELYFIPGVK